MKRVLIVGNAFSALRKYLEDNGYDYIVLKDRRLTKYPDKRFKRRVVCDFGSRESIIKTVGSIKKPIDGVMVTYENYILPAAWIAEHLSLNFMPVESADACTDKQLMRTRFSKAPEKISPDFAVVTSEKDVAAFADSHDFPLILKPASLAKSLLVTKNDTKQELLANYRKTMEQIDRVYKKYSPNREPKLLIEEFLKGSIHSVDAFVDKDGEPHVLEQVVDYQTGYDIGYDDNFHYSRLLPSRLSQSDKDALRKCGAMGVRALDMRATPAHIEIIMTDEGPRIVEIGARYGGYRDRMHRLANGIDVQGAAVALSLGQKPPITATKDEPCAVLEIFPKMPGNFTGIRNREKLEALSSLEYMSVKAKPGQFVGKSSDGYKMCAVIILYNSDSAQFVRDLDFVNTHVAVATTR